MELKPYQERVLETFDLYLEELTTCRVKAEQARAVLAANPGVELEIPNFPEKAWSSLRNKKALPKGRQSHQYTSRRDGVERDLPSVCLKIPTGGGKTLVGAHCLSRLMGTYIGSNTGLVLWITPNEAIYSQTKKTLANRESSIRQLLDRVGAGRVKILEKDDPVHALDTSSNLCIMLLMLQSANRVTKETLRLFRDRGNVHGFFPPEGEIQAHHQLLGRIPNLDCYGQKDTLGATVKDSLGNVLRLLRPVVLLDEGHRAYTPTALKTIGDFNPSILLELSATPKDDANWLVDVRGEDLRVAQMIKLPINVKRNPGDDWKNCLRESVDKLNALQVVADALLAEESRYIRPILLVQVERTGKEQRDGIHIHVEDAREFLLTLGFDKSQVAAKTADINDLDKPENTDLLSPACAVRVILTKQALQEGWDCPFAYILCSLATNRNMNALTQLVGRILRQPQATFVDEEFQALNECYVFCHHAETREVVASIKSGLESDGLNDLAKNVRDTDGNAGPTQERRSLERREKYRSLRVFLPVVNWVEGDAARLLNYEEDILFGLPWESLQVEALVDRLAHGVVSGESNLVRLALGQGQAWLEQSDVQNVIEPVVFDSVYATRVLSDVVPNAWVARQMISNLIDGLIKRGLNEDKLGAMSSLILEELRKWIVGERDRLAEAKFMTHLLESKIQFGLKWFLDVWQLPYEMPTDEPQNARQLLRTSGSSLEKSIFAPVYQDDLNGDEANFACYLDTKATVQWWHRNVAKAGQYSLQGWKKNLVYPDFIFAHRTIAGQDQLAVWETKGDHLGGKDTEYKRKLLQTISDNYQKDKLVRAGELELIYPNETEVPTVHCTLVFMDEWRLVLDKALSS